MPRTIWHCPREIWCGQAVSFDWAPDGRRLAFTLDEIGGNSTYVGLHVVNTVSGRDTQIPAGAPRAADAQAWSPYLSKMLDRVGCWPASELDWSPDGSSLAYRCGSGAQSGTSIGRPHINVLRLNGSGYTTVATSTDAFWPSWSPPAPASPTRRLCARPTKARSTRSRSTARSDGCLLPARPLPRGPPNGRTIAYQTRCGLRLVTPTGRDVTPRLHAKRCGSIGLTGPPVWSPDGKKIAVETRNGIYAIDARGSRPHRVSEKSTTTWYGALPGRPSWQPIH